MSAIGRALLRVASVALLLTLATGTKEYKSINRYLTKNVHSDELAPNLAKLKELQVEQSGSDERLVRSIKELVELATMASSGQFACDPAEHQLIVSADLSTEGGSHFRLFRAKSHTRLEQLLHNIRARHAHACLGNYAERHAELLAELEPEVVKSVELFTDRVILRHKLDEGALEKPSLKDVNYFGEHTSSYASAGGVRATFKSIEQLEAGSAEWQKLLAARGNKQEWTQQMRALFNKNIAGPCELFTSKFRELFEAVDFEREALEWKERQSLQEEQPALYADMGRALLCNLVAEDSNDAAFVLEGLNEMSDSE